jgi:hypothetical protein
MSGLLDGLLDPEIRAEVAERSRIIARVAEQLGKSRKEAAARLLDFEACTSSEGQVLH